MHALLFAFAAAASPALADDAIIGGSTTSDFLAVGQLAGYHDRYGLYPFCSGTLVRDTWVISAAHCVDGAQDVIDYGFDILFIVGDNVTSSSGIVDYVEVVDMIKHPDYRSYRNDVAVVELAGDGLPDVPKISLNEDAVMPDWRGSDMTYVGWGISSDRGSGSGVKRTVDVPIVEYDSDIIYTWDSDGGANICSGDSGGAALRPDPTTGELELVGVNSFGFMVDGSAVLCDDPDAAAGVSRIDSTLEWIVDYVGEPPMPEPEEDPDAETDDTLDGEDGDAPDLGESEAEGAGTGEIKGSSCASVGSLAGGTSGGLALGLGLLGLVARRRDR